MILRPLVVNFPRWRWWRWWRWWWWWRWWRWWRWWWWWWSWWWRWWWCWWWWWWWWRRCDEFIGLDMLMILVGSLLEVSCRNLTSDTSWRRWKDHARLPILPMLPIPPYIPIMGLQIQRRKTSCYQGFQRVIATFANSLRVAAGIHRKNTSDLGTRNIEKLPSVHLVLHKRMVEKTSRLQVAQWSSIGGV